MTIAFFPGKFQPPHIGHIETLVSFYEKYDKIIIGITEDKPQIMEPLEVKNTFSSIFKYLPKYEFELIAGVFVDSSSFDHLPEFDVLLSGNKKVIHHARKLGINSKFVKRSKGFGYSGTEVRKLI